MKCDAAVDSGVGAGIDSYYEYLLKAYIMLGDETYLDRFNKVRLTTDVSAASVSCRHHHRKICNALIMRPRIKRGLSLLSVCLSVCLSIYQSRSRPPTYNLLYTVVQKNAPTLADYNYDPVQWILIIFSKLFANDHKSCLVVKFSTSPHICCHYTL